jgi:transcriptional regulator with XRE-family HTH domain
MCLQSCAMSEPRKRRAPTTAVAVDGAKLRKLRKQRGIEVADLAARIGVGRPYITKLELGHSKRASVRVYAALLRELEIDDYDALLPGRSKSARVA